MAKAKAAVDAGSDGLVVEKTAGNGNDPRVVRDEAYGYLDKLHNRIAGTHRWRVQLPNFVYYLYFDCDVSDSFPAQAKGEFQQATGISLTSACKFEYAGPADTPAPVYERIPREKRINTRGRMPERLVSFMKG